MDDISEASTVEDTNVEVDNIEKELAIFRKQIDEIDNVIISQLKKRIGIVKQVGSLKYSKTNIPCPIRPGREAEMIRDITERFAESDFPAASAAAIWRIIIGASTNVESKLTTSIFSDEKESKLYWLAREYFGPNIPIIKQPYVKRVISDVIEDKASVGIVPNMDNISDDDNWWVLLLQQGENSPKIFAHIPFVNNQPTDRNNPSALAIAKLIPEPSGDDISIIVIEAEHNVSQNRLQTIFSSIGLNARWLTTTTINPASRHHLIEVRCFVDENHEELKQALSALGRALFRCYFLGAYATPIDFTN
ncbi:MAG: chorismate mutase [Rickettsiales bacterium]